MLQIRRWAGALLAAAVSLSGFIPAAEAFEDRVLRVGFPIQAGLSEVDGAGNHTGYTYEYLEEIAQYTGWSYEFVEIPGSLDDSLTAMYEMLERGELDLMGGTAYTDSMAESLDYIPQNYGMAYTVLFVPEENTTITQRNLPGFQGLRVAAFERAVYRQKELEAFCQANGIEYELVLCQNDEERFAAVAEGRADAILDVDMNWKEGLRTVARFSPRPYYFVTTKGNTDIVRRMNAAITDIDSSDPFFSTTLYERYFGGGLVEQLFLSDDERDFVDQAATLRVGVQLDKAPFMYREEETGELRGISLDLLSSVAQATGLEFQWVPAEDQAEMDRLLAGGEIDLVAGMSYDYGLARERGVSMTRPYVSAQYIMLLGAGVNEESQTGLRLALPSDLTYDGGMPESVTYYDDLESCIEAVRQGRADYTYGDGYTVQYFVNQGRYRNIRLVPQTYEPHKVCVGLVRPSSEVLLTILNKGILSITDEDLQSIIYQNTVYQREATLWDLVEADPGGALALVVGLAGLIIAALAALLYSRMRRIRQDALDLKKHYELYALSNEQFFEYDFLRDTLTVSHKAGDKGVRTISRTGFQAAEDGQTRYWRDFFWSLLRDREDGSEDIRCPAPGGGLHWMRVTTRRVCSQDGTPVYLVGKLSDIDEEKRELDKLVDQAQRDGLTGLYNATAARALIESRLASGRPGAMLIIDLDHFKEVNDTYGHFTGDETLRRLSAVLRELFRRDDVAGRLGGDEFMVYMDRAPDREAVEKRCAALIHRARDVDADGCRVTISVGAVLTAGGEDYESLYRRADEALYRAKESGRDGFHIG